MSMSLATLEVLEEAQFPPAQARALARIFENESARRDDLATKTDLTTAIAGLRQELKTDISELRQELKTDISELRQELRADISALRQEVKTDILELRQELKADTSGLRTEMKDMTQVISEAKVDNMRWTFLALVGQTTLLAGVMYFLLQNVR